MIKHRMPPGNIHVGNFISSLVAEYRYFLYALLDLNDANISWTFQMKDFCLVREMWDTYF